MIRKTGTSLPPVENEDEYLIYSVDPKLKFAALVARTDTFTSAINIAHTRPEPRLNIKHNGELVAGLVK